MGNITSVVSKVPKPNVQNGEEVKVLPSGMQSHETTSEVATPHHHRFWGPNVGKMAST